MTIDLKYIKLDVTLSEIQAIVKKTWEVLNMAAPLWIFLFLLICLYIYLWRQAIWKWNLLIGLDALRAEIYGVKERYLTDKQTESKLKDDLLEKLKSEEIFSWPKPSFDKPSFFKPYKWRIF